MKILRSDNGPNTVWKYVFDTEFSGAMCEAVLYRYNTFEERTVLCISVQSGCAVGCTFCGTGANFVRNLTYHEIVYQAIYILNGIGLNIKSCKKLQIMFMSMGEPFHNYKNVQVAIGVLHQLYPSADLLVSTILPKVPIDILEGFAEISAENSKIGLQFSIHKSTDEERNKLIPLKAKHSLSEIAEYGKYWNMWTRRRPYCNYCVDGSTTIEDMKRLIELFDPMIFCFTLSVICSKDETMKDAGYRNMDHIRLLESYLLSQGCSVRIFDPQGQDDISGGCGQLWEFQRFFREHKK